MRQTMTVVALALLIAASLTACAGRDFNPPDPMKQVKQPAESAGYVNQILNPDLPANVYRDCMAGAWTGTANSGSSGEGHHIDASHSCVPTPTRSGGKRLYGKMSTGAAP